MEKEETKPTRKDIVSSALIGARNADSILIEITDQLENLLGKEAPIVTRLHDAMDELNGASDIICQFTARCAPIDADTCQAFTEWLNEDGSEE